MLSQTYTKITTEEYLSAERQSEVKHEFFDGAIFAMAGASKNHNQICSNLVRMIGNQLLGESCSVYASDMRIKAEKTKKYSYPDVVVACVEAGFEDDKEDTLLNPLLIFEVLSDSTEAYDRGDKFFHYRQIPSFVEYVLVSQKNCHLERFVRQSDHTWQYSEVKTMNDSIQLHSIDCAITVQDIYDKVNLKK